MEDKSLCVVLRREIEAEMFPKGVTAEQIRLLDRLEQVISKAYTAGYKSAHRFPVEGWSNNACLGYALIAAESLGYNEKQAERLIRSIYSEFDVTSIGEARSAYEESPY